MLKRAAAAVTVDVVLTTVPGAAANATQTGGTLKVSKSSAAVSTRVDFTGKLPTKVKRPVILQRKTSGGWVKVASDRTTRRGKFSIRQSVPGTAGIYPFRVAAKKYDAGRKTYKALKTPTVKVTVTAAPAPAPPPPTTPTPPPPPAPGSRENPYLINTPFQAGPWQFVVGAADFDAWPEIQAENPFNEPPAPGWSYVTVPVTFTYLGADTGLPWLDTEVDFVGNDGVVYDDGLFGQDCGVVPDSVYDIGELYPGATATGLECVAVPTSAISGGLWRVADDSSLSRIYRFVRAS
jgi:hypothetical protein